MRKLIHTLVCTNFKSDKITCIFVLYYFILYYLNLNIVIIKELKFFFFFILMFFKYKKNYKTVTTNWRNYNIHFIDKLWCYVNVGSILKTGFDVRNRYLDNKEI